jgi:hypothetical protein
MGNAGKMASKQWIGNWCAAPCKRDAYAFVRTAA